MINIDDIQTDDDPRSIDMKATIKSLYTEMADVALDNPLNNDNDRDFLMQAVCHAVAIFFINSDYTPEQLMFGMANTLATFVKETSTNG